MCLLALYLPVRRTCACGRRGGEHVGQMDGGTAGALADLLAAAAAAGNQGGFLRGGQAEDYWHAIRETTAVTRDPEGLG